ncbi:membrane protein [Oceanisphaera marina]|uniref:Membrane protein n=1 Tax=Oceanisphaera marina TaxID=2017550 RepID=A0ABQ1IKD4_9GAMM|nr:DUF1190 domain-containing protein [Oceanisphaera marina]GGB40276.1 membrane protein [Oceanisphaera marina]
MKRSKRQLLSSMSSRIGKPVSAAIAGSVLLSACGQNDTEVQVYQSPDDCSNSNPELAEQCRAAYQQALAESAETAPKYDSRNDCEADFGGGSCTPYQYQGNSWFMPAMAGFMFGRMLNGNRYAHTPVYSSRNPYSPYYGQWTTANGQRLGKASYGKRMSVGKDALAPKPKVTRTISRGGFGSAAQAKSSWRSNKSSSRSRSRGWGG